MPPFSYARKSNYFQFKFLLSYHFRRKIHKTYFNFFACFDEIVFPIFCVVYINIKMCPIKMLLPLLLFASLSKKDMAKFCGILVLFSLFLALLKIVFFYNLLTWHDHDLVVLLWLVMQYEASSYVACICGLYIGLPWGLQHNSKAFWITRDYR